MTHPFQKLFTEAEQSIALAQLRDKLSNATKLLLEHPFSSKGLYIGHSGGKDSVVVNFITDKVLGTNIPIIHSAKPSGENAVHLDAARLIYEIAEKRPVLLYPRDVAPLAEYDTQIDGTKICEYDRTDGRHTDVIIDGELKSRLYLTPFIRNGLFGKNYIFPLFDWLDYHVWATIYTFNLRYSNEYDA
jgi:3'-phosphoadenosine 5'-phosphosulfate sulfotransferase (PAPS reductase)/FAD synthetase